MTLISSAFHPLLMATYVSLVLLIYDPELFAIQPQARLYFLLIVFITTGLMPGISIFVLKQIFHFSSLELTNREERPLPFLTILIWYAISSYLFVERLEINPPFSTIIISITLLIAILFIITQWFKISIHATAIWCASGILAAMIFTQGLQVHASLYAFILAAGITCSSRLYLGYHQPKEIWSGTFLGFGFGFCATFWFS